VTTDLRARIEELRVRGRARDVGLRQAPAARDDLRSGVRATTGAQLVVTGPSPTAAGHLSDEELAQQLGGHYATEGLIVIERRVPLGAHHGRWPLGAGVDEALTSFGHGTGNAVFLDTETTGLAGGVGTVAFVVGLARVTKYELEVAQYLLTAFAGESELLRAAQEFVADSTTVVTYNGKSFDVPLLTTRYRLAGLRDPLQELTHIDLLHATRRLFRKRWPDCRLPTAEERLLRLWRGDDLPGAEVPHAWLNWLQFGDWQELPRVLRHNALDVASIIALVPALEAARQQQKECSEHE
jgi:uncharacterized protein